MSCIGCFENVYFVIHSISAPDKISFVITQRYVQDLHFKSALVYELFDPYNSDSLKACR